ncbi:unnamed protein product [Arctia plantaginis]|uniref:Uncharacterized protein n=1 Tax=Arctia plantaginis TaxID=874455 RepID=A0A8S0Z7I2_ARCPL|nr:unnamed protein product [Arctia plantaginis]
MDKLKLILLKILLLTTVIVILSANTVDAKKNKKFTQHNISKEPNHKHTENNHKKLKRSAHGKSWGSKQSYGSYDLPPYLVYNKKLGAYYPYFKYPENNLRRYFKNKHYSTTNNNYNTLPRNVVNRNVK